MTSPHLSLQPFVQATRANTTAHVLATNTRLLVAAQIHTRVASAKQVNLYVYGTRLDLVQTAQLRNSETVAQTTVQ